MIIEMSKRTPKLQPAALPLSEVGEQGLYDYLELKYGPALAQNIFDEIMKASGQNALRPSAREAA